jgi:methyl-accepting chemotaxis protein
MILLLQLAAAADTVLVRNVPPSRTVFEQIVFVTQGMTSILLFLLVCVMVGGLLLLRARADQLEGKLDHLIDELKPMARNATAMSEEVREVAKNINAMVDDSRDTVTVINDRVRTAAVALADQVEDLTGIIGRVNASAARMASVATTTMAGLKVGARVMGLGKKRKKKRADADDRPRLRRRD